jgi:hypothetical protein
VDKVSGSTCRSAGLLAGRVHSTGTSGTLVGGDPWVPISHTPKKIKDKKSHRYDGKRPIYPNLIHLFSFLPRFKFHTTLLRGPQKHTGGGRVATSSSGGRLGEVEGGYTPPWVATEGGDPDAWRRRGRAAPTPPQARAAGPEPPKSACATPRMAGASGLWLRRMRLYPCSYAGILSSPCRFAGSSLWWRCKN